jgi:hypothetical protein
MARIKVSGDTHAMRGAGETAGSAQARAHSAVSANRSVLPRL